MEMICRWDTNLVDSTPPLVWWAPFVRKETTCLSFLAALVFQTNISVLCSCTATVCDKPLLMRQVFFLADHYHNNHNCNQEL